MESDLLFPIITLKKCWVNNQWGAGGEIERERGREGDWEYDSLEINTLAYSTPST